MKALASCLLASAALLTHSAALGQNNTTAPVVSGSVTVFIDGDRADTVYINSKQCEEGAKVRFVVNNLPTGNVAVTEVWRAPNNTTDCNAIDGRKFTQNSTSTTPCVHVEAADKTTSATQLTFELEADKLFDCKSSSWQTIFFVPLSGATTDTSGTNPTPSSSSTKISASFQVDVSPPGAVGGIEPSNGEHEIGASWDNSDDTNTRRYRLYFDKSAISESGSGCSSSNLTKGQFAMNLGDLHVENVSASEGGVDPESLGMVIGQQIPIAVAVQDQAQNDSKLSEVVCASYIETTGFWEKYEAEGGDGLHECSAHPSARTGGLTGWLLLTLGGLLLVRRKA